MDKAGKLALKILVSGRVQGVAYRKNTLNHALEFNIKGWVRNLSTGEVEIFAEGTQYQLDLFLETCHKGSVMAKVTKLYIEEVVMHNYPNFEIRYDK